MGTEHRKILRSLIERSALDLLRAFKGNVAYSDLYTKAVERYGIPQEEITHAVDRGQELAQNYIAHCKNIGAESSKEGLFIYLVSEVGQVFDRGLEKKVPAVTTRNASKWFNLPY